MRQTCTDHCSGCGRHFHGLGAYDAHLKRVNERKNRWDAPAYDLQHLDGAAAGLEPWTADGACDLATPEQEHVTVWRVPMTEAKREALARLGGRASSDTSSRGGPEATGVEPDTLAPSPAPGRPARGVVGEGGAA